MGTTGKAEKRLKVKYRIRKRLEGTASRPRLSVLKAKDLNLEDVVFDRNGFLYHGRIKAIADGAREGGLKF